MLAFGCHVEKLGQRRKDTMSEAITAVAVAAGTSLLVAAIGPWIVRGVESTRERRRVADEVNLRYLAPLRQQLAEAAFRNREVLLRVRPHDVVSLRQVDDLDQLATKPLDWFAGAGCYLLSTTYFTACLFAEFVRLRDAYPFLRLRERGRDAELTGLVLRVRLAFAGDGGVYYAAQAAIGADLLQPDGAPASYQAFVGALRNRERCVWYGQLIMLYRRLADGDGLARLERVVAAMQALSACSTTRSEPPPRSATGSAPRHRSAARAGRHPERPGRVRSSDQTRVAGSGAGGREPTHRV
jgi:hypothetical protein